MVHKRAEFAQKSHGLRAKLFNKKRHAEKAEMKKTIAMHEEKKNKQKKEDAMPEGAVPPYLLDREGVSRAKVSHHVTALMFLVAAQGNALTGAANAPLTPSCSLVQVLSNTVKQKRKEKAGKWSVPVPKVLPVPQHESVSIMDTIIRYVIFTADPNPPSIGFSRIAHNATTCNR